jgi:hypothetical protein
LQIAFEKNAVYCGIILPCEQTAPIKNKNNCPLHPTPNKLEKIIANDVI